MRRHRLLPVLAIVPALAAGQAVAAQSAQPPSGCQPTWTVVAHLAGGKRLPSRPSLVACVTETGYATSEPTLVVTSRGTVVMSPAQSENTSARSADGGRTWNLTAPAVEQYTSLWNTVDPNMTVDRRTGRIYLVHATGPTRTTPVLVDESPLPNGLPTAIAAASGFQVYSSGDEGRTWTTADYQTAPMGDWEKVFVGPASMGKGSVVYVCGNSPFEVSGPGRLCYSSHDNGATFSQVGYVFPSATEPKSCPALAANNGSVGPDGTVYQPVSCNDGSYVAVSKDEGASYTWYAVPGTKGNGTSLMGQMFQVAADQAGTVYAAWADGDRLLLATSRDGAQHWSSAVDVAVPGAHVITIPQLTTGAAGQVGLAYYAANKAGGTALTAWVTQASGRTFVSAALSDPKRPTFTAQGVSGPTPRADYVGAVFDSRGRLWVAMVRQGPTSPDGHTIAAFGIVGHLEPRRR